MRRRRLPASLLVATAPLLSLSAAAAETGDSAQTMEVVTVTGYSQDMTQAPASISVISGAELQQKAYRDVAEALQDIPGVFVEGGPSRKGGTTEVSIRGMQSKYTLILVDGKPQGSRQGYYNGFGKGAEFGWLPPVTAIKRIEVVRGPMSSLYGSDALGGVINIITHKQHAAWTGTLNADTTLQDDSDSGDRRQLRYHVSGPLVADTLSLTLTGSLFQRDEDNIHNGYKDMEKVYNAAALDWRVNDAHDLALEIGLADQESSTTEEKSGSSGDLETTRTFYAVTHDADWGKASTTSFVQHEDLDNDTQSAKYQRTTVNSMTNIPLARAVVVLGGQYREQQTENPVRAINKATLQRWDMALFSEAEYSFTDSFTLTGGVRWVDDEKYGSEFTPRLYGVYAVNDQVTIKGGTSRGYRTPDLKQGDSQWVEGGGGRRINGADIGNSDLKPEESINYELSFHWRNHQGLTAGVTAYQTDFTDRIEKNIICEETSENANDCLYLEGEYQRIYQYQNVAEAELSGVEVHIGYSTDRFSASLNYTYADSEIQTGDDKGEPLNNYPDNAANLSLSWQPAEQYTLWTKIKYKSATVESGDSERPAYTLADIGGSYQITKPFSIYGGIYNIADKTIRYDDYSRVLDGRRYTIGAQYTF